MSRDVVSGTDRRLADRQNLPCNGTTHQPDHTIGKSSFLTLKWVSSPLEAALGHRGAGSHSSPHSWSLVCLRPHPVGTGPARSKPAPLLGARSPLHPFTNT